MVHEQVAVALITAAASTVTFAAPAPSAGAAAMTGLFKETLTKHVVS